MTILKKLEPVGIARGVITTYGYDGLNRPQTVSCNTSAAPLVAATAGATISYKTTTPGKGQVSSVTDGLGSETYAFDQSAFFS